MVLPFNMSEMFDEDEDDEGEDEDEGAKRTSGQDESDTKERAVSLVIWLTIEGVMGFVSAMVLYLFFM